MRPYQHVSMPIRGGDIPHFRQWIAWNGFSHSHPAFDFAAYEERDGRCMLGLLDRTPVRAVADGVVVKTQYGSYQGDVMIEHTPSEIYLLSGYTHVVPLVEEGQRVRQGDVIATLYNDPGHASGRLVHLHFYMTRSPNYIEDGKIGNEQNRYLINPQKIMGRITPLVARPQGEQEFSVPRQRGPLRIRNFSVLDLADWEGAASLTEY